MLDGSLSVPESDRLGGEANPGVLHCHRDVEELEDRADAVEGESRCRLYRGERQVRVNRQLQPCLAEFSVKVYTTHSYVLRKSLISHKKI